jgi:hypothetical protein
MEQQREQLEKAVSRGDLWPVAGAGAEAVLVLMLVLGAERGTHRVRERSGFCGVERWLEIQPRYGLTVG